MHPRRSWLQAAALLPFVGAAATMRDGPPRRVLVLGGTQFVGRHFVIAALARGHTVTLFNRGRTNPHLFPEATRIFGDRQGDHAELRGRTWDVVVDTSGVEPDQVQRAAEVLAGSVERYIFVSSSAAYEGGPEPFTEDHPLRTMPAAGPVGYGEKKARGEQWVRELHPAHIVVRPAVLVGPYDTRHRFVRYPLRAREGGEFLAPGSRDVPAPLADARDLAAWLVRMIERDGVGTFNIAGPPPTMGAVIDAACRYGAGTPVWVDAEWLYARKILFDSLPSMHLSGYHRMTSARAEAEGLRFRSVAQSMADTVAWWDAQASKPALKGMARVREQELIATWRARG